MFGVCSAVEIFQRIMEAILAPCNNCLNFLDDIIIFGATEKEHNQCLKKIMSTLDAHKVTLNKSKFLFKVQELDFLERVLSNQGIKVDLKKVDTIMNFRAPKTKEELRSFLELYTYVGKFIPDLGTETNLLRQLLKADVKFDWIMEHEQKFTKLKNSLANLPTLTFF